MYGGIRKKLRDRSRTLHFLTSSEGGVVFWLWTLGQHMRGEEIAAYLSMYLPVYYPFVHRNSLNAITALAAYRRAQDVSERRCQQSVQHALLERPPEALVVPDEAVARGELAWAYVSDVVFL